MCRVTEELMPTGFLHDAAFGPDEIAVMIAAYEVGLTHFAALTWRGVTI